MSIHLSICARDENFVEKSLDDVGLLLQNRL